MVATDRLKKSTIARTLPFAVSMSFRTAPYMFLLLCTITFLQGFCPAATIWIHKYVIDSIVAALGASAGLRELLVALRNVGLEVLILGLVQLATHASVYARGHVGAKLSLGMRSEFLTRLSMLDLIYFEDAGFHDKTRRAANESGSKPLSVVMGASDMTRYVITFVSMGLIIINLHWLLFILSLVTCVPYLLIQVKYGRQNYRLEYARTEDSRRAGYLYGTMTNRQLIPEVASFSVWPYLFRKWSEYSGKFIAQDLHLAKRRGLMLFVAEVLATLGRGAALGFIVYLGFARPGRLTVGEIIMYSGAFTGVASALGRGFDSLASIYQDSLFLDNFIEFQKIKPIMLSRNKSKPVPDRVESMETKDLGFRYPGREEYALRGVNLAFKRGQCTLVVGSNGAGKTTLMKLLTRLYDPTEGQILLNGADLRDYDLESVRRRIGVVFQEFVRYALTARENISCGCSDGPDYESRMVEAARLARAHIFIEKLPLQYETVLSKEFTGGQELSLGQWQRICIARLFFKNAPMLILDEPTACLDIETEAHLLQEMAQLSRGRISVLVSHRMFRPGLADQIIMLGHGSIVECGTYEELVAANGEFARLCRLYHNLGNQGAMERMLCATRT
jgi:ATP-binding cassette subfamily B protein